MANQVNAPSEKDYRRSQRYAHPEEIPDQFIDILVRPL
jgi:hypothetical protein